MNRFHYLLACALMAMFVFNACSRLGDPVDETEQGQVETPSDEGEVLFALQLTGTFTGHCCDYYTDRATGETTHSYSTVTHTVELSEANSSDLMIDGIRFVHTGSDASVGAINYRSTDERQLEVVFRKEGSILNSTRTVTDRDGSFTSNCDSYKE